MIDNLERLPAQTPEDHPEDLSFETELVGKINEKEIHLIGEGTIDETGGTNEGEFEVDKLPDEIDGRSLGAFLFTGYPNSCRISQSGINNPFMGGDYHYSRRYIFSTGEEVLLKVKCILDNQKHRLRSIFELSGRMPKLKNIDSVSPIYELWSPEENHINGSFGVAWLNGEGKVVNTASALSSYTPVDLSAIMGRPKHRYLKLDSKYLKDKRLFVKQISTMD